MRYTVYTTEGDENTDQEVTKEACHIASSLFSGADDETKIKAARICIGIEQ